MRTAAHGASAVVGLVSSLPLRDNVFDLVCAFDIVEHVEDDEGALSELWRVAAPGATLLLSVPLHPAQWTAFDDFVGHRRRYPPEQLLEKLAGHGFAVHQSAAYGMQPSRHACWISGCGASSTGAPGDVVVQPRIHAMRCTIPAQARAGFRHGRHRRRGRNPAGLPEGTCWSATTWISSRHPEQRPHASSQRHGQGTPESDARDGRNHGRTPCLSRQGTQQREEQQRAACHTPH